MNTVIPVILSGGCGTRLWPTSRKQQPKQLLKLNGELSSLQQTVQSTRPFNTPIVVCNQEQRFMISHQLQDISCDALLMLEPHSRNTAPAIAVAALQALYQEQDPILLVLPADHMITDHEAFKESFAIACQQAEQNKIVLFGCNPADADSELGYMQVSQFNKKGAQVLSFVEKPELEQAQLFISQGDYFCNSGVYVMKASAYLAELGHYQPEILSFCQQAFAQANHQSGAICLAEKAFQQCPSNSIDYAILEQSKNSWMVPLASPWNDLANWSSLWRLAEKDISDNVQWGDVLAENCQRSLFHSDDRLIAAIGVEDLIIVDSKDAVLVVAKSHVQEVKGLVSKLEQAGRCEHEVHREVARPWGSYDSIDQGERYQVKHITVNPKQSLSLQMHHHRAEHWIIVSGTALVQRGEEEMLVSENESVYIPIGEKHRLTNPGKLPLQLIEVQSGCYLGEDDIVRYSDIYDRVEDKKPINIK